MVATFVRITSAIKKRDERKVVPQHFTPCIVDVHPYKHILLPRYRVPQKTVKFVEVVSKNGRQCALGTCVHRNAI